MGVWISLVVVPLGEPLLLRPRLRTAPRVIVQEGGRPHAGPPATMSRLDLRFHGIEVEAGASLHRRVLDGRHDELLHLLQGSFWVCAWQRLRSRMPTQSREAVPERARENKYIPPRSKASRSDPGSDSTSTSSVRPARMAVACRLVMVRARPDRSGQRLRLGAASPLWPRRAGSTSVIAAALPSSRNCSAVLVANTCMARAMVPVHPVWWLAPRPAPLSPWKYSKN